MILNEEFPARKIWGSEPTSNAARAEAFPHLNPKERTACVPAALNIRCAAWQSLVAAKTPSLAITLLREFTYPNIFYKHFRNGYVHQYSDDPLVDQNPMTGPIGNVIYTHFTEPPPHCKVHFTVAWLAEVARSIIKVAEPVSEQRPLAKPEPWWIEGG